jgi:threonylcarbamoyladenosine tRNA methylthiotransferase MtaB
MKSFSINSLGCKVNQYESEQIRELLENLGLVPINSLSRPADLVVVNTCCVTVTASAKSRQYVRKARRLNPNAKIIVSGCLPIVETGEFNNEDKHIHLIQHRHELASTLSQIACKIMAEHNLQKKQNGETTYIIKTENGIKVKSKKLSTRQKLPQITSFKGHTRAFLKIQDGCDAHCTYCIVPKTRPFVRSKPIEAVIEESQRLVGAGHKEIVVTGVFLGAYGKETVRREKWEGKENKQLAELLERMAQINRLARIRLSSLEPGDVTEGLINVFCKYRNIMPHLHLSLQSGSDKVLRRMGRRYGREEFMEKVELIRGRLGRPAITTDLIAGFPGETESEFEETMEFARRVGFSRIHVFPFSARAGTAAAKMQETVEARVKKERASRLRELGGELGRKFREQFIGETEEVLTEEKGGEIVGRSERYYLVYFNGGRGKVRKNELVRVKLTENREDGVYGEVENVEQIRK